MLRLGNIRRTNRAVILQLLRYDEELSRADIARQSGLSEPATSRIIAGLIRDGLVFDSGNEKPTGGRPGRRLQLNPRRVALGVEIDNLETRFAVTNMRGGIIETWSLPTPSDAQAAIELVASEVLRRRKIAGMERIPGIGICMRGIVDSRSGVLVQGNRPEWARVAVRSILEARLDEPVYVDNDVRAAAQAEYSFGPSEVRAAHCLIFLGVNEGVGATILLDGKIHYGPRMAAGEFGQMVLCPSLDKAAGREICLEELTANGAICERYRALSAATGRLLKGDASAGVRQIAQWAAEGDGIAHKSLEETALHLGTGIANMVWGLDADVVVVDGAITRAWQIISPLLRKRLPDVYQASRLPVLLRPSALGGDAAVIGAASMPFHPVFASTDPIPRLTSDVPIRERAARAAL